MSVEGEVRGGDLPIQEPDADDLADFLDMNTVVEDLKVENPLDWGDGEPPDSDEGEVDEAQPDEDSGDAGESQGDVPEETAEDDGAVAGGDDEVLEASDDLLARAVGLGIPFSDARRIDPDRLESMVYALEGQQGGRKPATPELADVPEITLDLEVTDELPENLVQAINGALAQMNSTVRQQAEVISNLKAGQAANAEESERVAQRAFFEGLDADVQKLAGGPDVSRHSREGRKWREIVDTYEMLNAGVKSGNRVSPGQSVLMRRALNAVLGDEIQTITRQSISKSLTKKKGQHIGRPGSPTRKPKSRTSKAVNSVRRMMEDAGVDPGTLED